VKGRLRAASAGTQSWWMAILALLALALAGCGSPSSPSIRPTGLASPSPSSVATNYRYLNPTLYPAQDTPLIQASAQLQAVWTAYDVTVIPGQHILDAMPTPPKVLNLTNGKLSDADARALAWSEYRENAFLGWLEAKLQPGLNDHIRAHGLFNGVIGNAVRAGQAVTNPACGLYASQIAVIPVDQAVVTFEEGKGYSVTSQFALVDRYNAPCTVSTAAGPLFTASSDVVIVETGSVRHDEVLGDVYFAESGRDCQPGSAISACGAFK
jgi:hypothetical protein